MVFYVKVLCACMCYVYVYVCTCDRSELSRWHHGTHVQSWCFVSKTIIRDCLPQSVSFHPLRRGSVRTHGHRALTIHWIGCVYSQCSGNGLEVGYSVGIGRSWSPKWSALCCVHKEWDTQTVAPHAKAELSIWRPNRTTNTVSSYCLDYSRCVDIECSPRIRSLSILTEMSIYCISIAAITALFGGVREKLIDVMYIQHTITLRFLSLSTGMCEFLSGCWSTSIT